MPSKKDKKVTGESSAPKKGDGGDTFRSQQSSKSSKKPAAAPSTSTAALVNMNATDHEAASSKRKRPAVSRKSDETPLSKTMKPKSSAEPDDEEKYMAEYCARQLQILSDSTHLYEVLDAKTIVAELRPHFNDKKYSVEAVFDGIVALCEEKDPQYWPQLFNTQSGDQDIINLFGQKYKNACKRYDKSEPSRKMPAKPGRRLSVIFKLPSVIGIVSALLVKLYFAKQKVTDDPVLVDADSVLGSTIVEDCAHHCEDSVFSKLWKESNIVLPLYILPSFPSAQAPKEVATVQVDTEIRMKAILSYRGEVSRYDEVKKKLTKVNQLRKEEATYSKIAKAKKSEAEALQEELFKLKESLTQAELSEGMYSQVESTLTSEELKMFEIFLKRHKPPSGTDNVKDWFLNKINKISKSLYYKQSTNN